LEPGNRTQAALDTLVGEGWVLERVGQDGSRHYRLNPDRAEDARLKMAALKDRQR
jgi:hypothetical protein